MKKFIFCLVFLQFGVFQLVNAQENIALGKSVSMSSTYTGYEGNSNNYVGSHATDGSASTVAATEFEHFAWLKVDLGSEYDLSKVYVSLWGAYQLVTGKVYIGNALTVNPNDFTEIGSFNENTSHVDFENLSGKVGQYLLIRNEHTSSNGNVSGSHLGVFDIQVEGEEYTEPEEEQSRYSLQTENIPGTIQAEYYDNGGEGIAYHDDNSKSGHANFRADDNVDVYVYNENHKVIGWTANSEWVEYTLNIAETADYNITVRAAAANSHNPGSLEISLNEQVLTSVDINQTGGWGNYQDFNVENINLQAGNDNVLKLKIVGGAFNIDYVKFEKEVATQERYSLQTENIPGTIQAEYYDNGGEGVAYHDDDEKGGNTTFRPNDNVDVNVGMVGLIEEGEWLEYTVDVTETGNYDIVLKGIGNSEENLGDVEVYLDNQLLTTIDVNYTAVYTNYFRVRNIQIEEGENRVLKLKFVNGGHLHIDYIEFDKFDLSKNLAYHRPTSQSSSDYAYNSNPLVSATAAFSGSKAVDGNESTYSKTTQHLKPWWLVDLKQSCDINKIKIKSSLNSGGAKVYVGNEASNDPSDFNYAGTISSYAEYNEFITDEQGRYILIQNNEQDNNVIELREVEVMGEVVVSDLALNKHTFQRTGHPNSRPSSNAVDGNANTSSLTGGSDYAFLRVDLGDFYDLSEVKLDLLGDLDTANFLTLFCVSDGIHNDLDKYQIVIELTHNHDIFSITKEEFNISKITGRYITVFKFSKTNGYATLGINSINAYGIASRYRHTYKVPNVALGKLIEMSSTYYESGTFCAATNATDEFYGSSWSEGNYAHTSIRNFHDPGPDAFPRKKEYPWLRIDLGEQHKIDRIKIYNRSELDCCNDRLEDFELYIGNVDCIDENRFTKVSSGLTGEYHQNFDVDDDTYAQYIMLKSNDDDAILNITELKVFGSSISSTSNNMRVYKNNRNITFNMFENDDENLKSIGDIDVYPNPNNGQFTLEYTAKSKGDILVRVMDITGRIVKTTKHYALEKGELISGIVKLDDSVNEGLYLVNITHGNGLNETVRIQKN